MTPADPHPLPPKASESFLLNNAIHQIQSITTNPIFANDACGACIATLEVGKMLAMAAPDQGPAWIIALCNQFHFESNCEASFSINDMGGVVTQVLANADVGGLDGQMLCEGFFGGLCPAALTTPLNLTGWFAKPKPNPLPPPKTPSGKRLKVLHISDVHLDPRYSTGSEANCTSSLCCRANNFARSSPNVTLFPAPRYGAYLCDTPFSLMLAALPSIPILAGVQQTGFDFTVFTGDLVSHDPDFQLSRDYVKYTEAVLYDLFKRELNSGPVYPVLGNHDTYNQAQDAPHALNPPLADQFSWNYDHVSSLWEQKGWIPESAVELARAHYAAYMVKRVDGLRIITLNTDFFGVLSFTGYRDNLFNFINMTVPDTSGMLRFLTDELQDAEDAGDRAWILGHVLSGWDGTNALLNPTNLFYQIVDRFSPHVIAGIFWGHTHEDELSIFYANNATVIDAENALAVSWVGLVIQHVGVIATMTLTASLTCHVVMQKTFDIVDAFTWMADVNSFPELDGQTKFGPTYRLEYSTRATYGANITWGPNDPLNATWWHLVSEQLEQNQSLVTAFNTFQGKSSVRTQPCTGECAVAKVCYMRSGSSSIAVENCPAGFGSVQ
ncbi:hypothetical protein NM688_g8072 [Phlebia brevispora]|uniref:Uncharacterized protein n=1 Tax=Phlebia brevispora TaxID=194682 RepID=A0ACC1RXP4_9APHY|nr:hypothetical protein NM688_g8072 [Phlebia brevispora]